jgi:trimethylamine:corrinoid methyltransferase-like protein
VNTGTISIGGATAPYTIAGCMAHSFATDFAGIALLQLVRKGSFCAVCSENSFMEPIRGNLGSAVPGLLADLAGMLRCLWNGIRVDDEHLALDLTHSIGPKGNYLGQRHTAVHCGENYWSPRYFGAKFPLSNSATIPDQDLIERIDDDLRVILATHRPEPLPEPARKEVRAILERFEGV